MVYTIDMENDSVYVLQQVAESNFARAEMLVADDHSPFGNVVRALIARLEYPAESPDHVCCECESDEERHCEGCEEAGSVADKLQDLVDRLRSDGCDGVAS